MLILQGDADVIVDPQDTIAYAHKNDIQRALFLGVNHLYGNPGEKERIVSGTELFLLNAQTDICIQIATGFNGKLQLKKGNKK